MDGNVTVNETYRELQAHIKRILKYEQAIRRAVIEKRADRRMKRSEGGGRAPLHVSKPTEMMALENLTALGYVYIQCGAKKAQTRIDNPEGWLSCVSFVRDSLSSFDKSFMSSAFRRPDWSVCEEFHMSSQKFYALKKEIIMKIAVKAAVDGLISFE